MKFCKDCAHCVPAFSDAFYRRNIYERATCSRTLKSEVYSVNLITGEPEKEKRKINYCFQERLENNLIDCCGSGAKYFEEKSALRSTPKKEAE